jgi:chemotaxis signal transduction protein
MLTTDPSHQLSSGNIDSLRVMLFSIAKQPQSIPENLFALPLEAIVKIIRCPALGTFKRGVSIVEIDQQTVTVIDLCYRLAPERPAQAADRQFLMLLQTHSGDLCGIPVATFPELMDLPVTEVRPIPAVYRQVNDIRFASHMASIRTNAQADTSERVLLMGMNHLLVEKLAMIVDRAERAAHGDRQQTLELKAALN